MVNPSKRPTPALLIGIGVFWLLSTPLSIALGVSVPFAICFVPGLFVTVRIVRLLTPGFITQMALLSAEMYPPSRDHRAGRVR